MRNLLIAVVGALLLASASVRAEVRACAEPVRTAQGLIRGQDAPKYPACVWKGIPFAAPPTGELRFKPPQPPVPREGVYDAFAFGASCPQHEVLTSGGASTAFSEDCLFLNLWSPKKPGAYPVMFWIHGGGFREGAGTYDMYDGARLAAERGVVLVSVNYRIGALGFLALPELRKEDPNGSVGNYGMLDQIRALQWVKENIAAFGGDPKNVTVFGQSAGGSSACILLASPLAAGLVHRAIPMSGGCDMDAGLDRHYEMGERFATEVGCTGPDRLACLRAKTEKELVPVGHNLMLETIKGGGISHGPGVDGYLLTKPPIQHLQDGDYNHVPVMIGHTRDEIKLYALVIPGVSLMPKFAAKKLVRRMSKGKYDQVMELYSWKDFRRPSEMVFAMANEAFSSRGFVAAEAIAGGTPVYFYRFDWDDTRFRRKMGAFHGLDIAFAFGALNIDSTIAHILASKKTYQKAEPLSLQMMSYYTNFARTGNPNGEGLPLWPAYTVEKKERILLDDPITVVPLQGRELERYRFYAKEGYWRQ